MIRNEDYVQIRVPAEDLNQALSLFSKTLAYRRLSSRDGRWELVWDFKVHSDLRACEHENQALRAALRRVRELVSPQDMESITDAYRRAQEAAE